jgi:hypothetical protein
VHEAQLLDHRIGQEGVGRQCRAKEQRAGPAHAEPNARHYRRDQGEHEGKAAERGDIARAPPHHVEVDLESGQEHDVEQADRAEQFDHRLLGQDGGTAGPQQHAEQQQPDDAREARMLEQELHGQRRGHHHRELNQHVLDAARKSSPIRLPCSPPVSPPRGQDAAAAGTKS